MNDLNQIIRELNNVYRLYYGLYNDFTKLPTYKDMKHNTQSLSNPYNMYNKQKSSGQYTDKIKSFLFKEI